MSVAYAGPPPEPWWWPCDFRYRNTTEPGCAGNIRAIGQCGWAWKVPMACEAHCPPGQEGLLLQAYMNGLDDGDEMARKNVATTLRDILEGSDPHGGCDG